MTRMRVLPFVGWSLFFFLGIGPMLGTFFLILFSEPTTLFSWGIFLIFFVGYVVGAIPALVALLLFLIAFFWRSKILDFERLTLKSVATIGFLSGLPASWVIFRPPLFEQVLSCGLTAAICGVLTVRFQTPVGMIWFKKSS